MSEPIIYLASGVTALTALAILSLVALRGWNGWLALKREELHHGFPAELQAIPNTGSRIEIADLKERIRKLEAIAAGVDL